MQLIDATQSHPITPSGHVVTPPPTGPVTAPNVTPNTTWKAAVPASPPTPNPSVHVGSDTIGKVVDVQNLARVPYINVTRSPVGAFIQNVLGYAPRVEALSHGEFIHSTQSAGLSTNMLLAAADMCFQAHIPFGLRPEVLWFTIMSQIATAVKLNPETYRSLFTNSDGKETIKVRHDGLRIGSPYGWDQAIGMFDAPLRELVPGDLTDTCLPDDLTTCGTNENLACLIAFMDAASPYYDYRVDTLCGIPKVALFGTGQDWNNIVDRLNRLAPLFPDLADYFETLRPILVEVARTAGGASADVHFWKSIYKRDHESGGPKLTGWLTSFFLYTQNSRGHYRRNTLAWRDVSHWDGIDPCSFPGSIAAVPFVWNYFGNELPMQFVGGVITNVDLDGFMTPRLGWAVVHAG